MKRSFMLFGALILLTVVGRTADAGPNAGGSIILHDANLVYTTDTEDFCGLGAALSDCALADVNVEGSSYSNMKVWKMYACFPTGSSPSLNEVVFGIHYPNDIVVADGGGCGDGEQVDSGWPGSDTGASVYWYSPQTSRVVECYWFAGYRYSSFGDPPVFYLRDNPQQGGYFQDDSVPPFRDEIECYGSIGFDTNGDCCCDMGACCLSDGTCTFTSQGACPTGDWHAGIPCEPNPCHVIPTSNSSWGQIKRGYR